MDIFYHSQLHSPYRTEQGLWRTIPSIPPIKCIRYSPCIRYSSIVPMVRYTRSIRATKTVKDTRSIRASGGVMSLGDAHIPYTRTTRALLDPIATKADLVTAIQIHRAKSADILGSDPERLRRFLSRHETRYLTDTTNQLLRLGVVVRNGANGANGDSLAFVEPFIDYSICIPSCLDYNKFSLAELKTYLGLLSLCRYERKQFVAQVDLKTLADEAGISEKSVRVGLEGLIARRLVRAVKHVRRATEYFILDPRKGSLGWDIGELIRSYKEDLGGLPGVHSRYVRLLHDCDPHGLLKRGPVDGVRVFCPFCKAKKRKPGAKPLKPSLYIHSLILSMNPLVQQDNWSCAACRRSGDSARLWSKLQSWEYNPAGMPVPLVSPVPEAETEAPNPSPEPAVPDPGNGEDTNLFFDIEHDEELLKVLAMDMWREEK